MSSQNRRYKIRYILDELYLAVTWIIIWLIIYIDQLNTAYKILLLVIASTNPNFVNMKYTVNWLETCLKRELRMLRLMKSIPKTKYTNLILNKNKNSPFPMVEIYISIKCFVLKGEKWKTLKSLTHMTKEFSPMIRYYEYIVNGVHCKCLYTNYIWIIIFRCFYYDYTALVITHENV